MSKLAYIATLLYLPLTVVYANFYSDDNALLWNKYFYLLDKLYIVALLLSLIDNELLKKRKLIYCAGLGLIVLFLMYILIDWSEAFNYSQFVVSAYCTCGILFYLAVIIIYNDNPDQR